MGQKSRKPLKSQKLEEKANVEDQPVVNDQPEQTVASTRSSSETPIDENAENIPSEETTEKRQSSDSAASVTNKEDTTGSGIENPTKQEPTMPSSEEKGVSNPIINKAGLKLPSWYPLLDIMNESSAETE